MQYQKPTLRMKQTPGMIEQRRDRFMKAVRCNPLGVPVYSRLAAFFIWAIEKYLEIEDEQKREIMGVPKDEVD